MNTNVTCVMQVMWAIHADTYFSALHKHSVIGKQLPDVHNPRNKDLRDQFPILKKCRRKLGCLIYEMLFIKNKKPTLYINLTPLKQNFLFDSSSAPRLEFYFILFSLINHMYRDLHTYISLYYELT